MFSKLACPLSIRLRLTVASLIVFAALLPAAQASAAQSSEERLVALDRATPVREYAGRLLFSRWDGSAYRLATLHEGQVTDLPVPAQAKPFDADIGPDSAGKPSAVMSLCKGSCDLFVLGFDEGDELRPVRNANTTGNDETDPSVWKGRLVFAREYTTKLIPYTKSIKAPRSTPSDRLASLPDKRCGAFGGSKCSPIEDITLVQMELYGDRIAQSWTYSANGFGGFQQNEIRLTNVKRTDTRQLAFRSTGLSGDIYLGPSINKGRVAFFRACQGDQSGCTPDKFGAIRYNISTGDYELAGARESWTAWASNGTDGFHVPGAFDCGAGDGLDFPPTGACGIYRTPNLDWKPVDKDLIR